ncbi:uncharacterized protein [Diabrotica undecimpunctata]|uniref:uncharacterized protein n=1 Tax=Diabrotica undecimpunctata TaxID=50387 RepID=UPI003B633298
MSTIIYFMLLLFFVTDDFVADEIEIIDAGIFDITDGDIAIIFYLTLRNLGEKNADVSVSMNKCCDQTNSLDDEECVQMYLMGGHMGILKKKQIRNVTLIHPTMYPYFRKGICSITVQYRTEKYDKTIVKVINFRTNGSDEDIAQTQCPSVDTDPRDNCNQVDCVMKYFGEKSYFNPTSKECERVPICLSESPNSPDIAYNYISNQCINLNNSVTPSDLEVLENNQAEVPDDSSVNQNNKICHHGEFNTVNSNGECTCIGNWKTNLDNDETYEPSLMLYHMCNIEVGTWNCVNRTKIKTTVFIVAVLVITIASKIVLLMCILSWCYKHFKKNKPVVICTQENSDDLKKLLIPEPIKYNECVCSKLKLHEQNQRLHQETVDISYYPGQMNKRISFGKPLPDTSRSYANKEKEFSIQLSRSTSTTSNDEEYVDSTDNEDTKEEYLESNHAVNKENSKRSVQTHENDNSTDYSIRLSQTTSSPEVAQSEAEGNEDEETKKRGK